MPPRDEQSATVVVIELGEGQVYVKIVEPKPDPRWVEVLLRRTIDAWFNARPQFVIDRTKPVIEAGETLGICVWYHTEERPALPLFPVPADRPLSVTIEVSEPVLKNLPKEYIEAVVDEAIQAWNHSHERDGTLIVVNARKIAVILDWRTSRGAMVPVEAIYAGLDEPARRALQSWLGSLPTRLHVVEIARSWFEPYVVGWESVKLAEPSLVRYNMTYDTRRHLGP